MNHSPVLNASANPGAERTSACLSSSSDISLMFSPSSSPYDAQKWNLVNPTFFPRQTVKATHSSVELLAVFAVVWQLPNLVEAALQAQTFFSTRIACVYCVERSAFAFRGSNWRRLCDLGICRPSCAMPRRNPLCRELVASRMLHQHCLTRRC